MVFGRKKKQEQFKKVDVTRNEPPERNPLQELARETENEHKEKTRFQVVKELPTQVIRQVKAEDGTIINLITIEEALTEFINEEEE